MRVIDCDGSAQSSAVIAGLDWLAQNYKLPAVASMSLGSDSPNQALDDAVTAIIDLGITAVIAAGNYNQGQHPYFIMANYRRPMLPKPALFCCSKELRIGLCGYCCFRLQPYPALLEWLHNHRRCDAVCVCVQMHAS